MNKMVRESRHIWVGNLPENVREDQIQDFFSRFGRVEKVKLLTKSSPDGGKAAFVDFVDIRSATVANETHHRMGDRELRTNYNEPGGNKTQDYGRAQGVRNFGSYPGIPYRGQPVVIYAAPSGNHIVRSGPSYPLHPRDDRKLPPPYQPRRDRGRSPVSRESRSDDDRSLSPLRRSRGNIDYSSDSDASVGKLSKRSTICVQNLETRNSDSTLEEALYYEFKTYGLILNIIIKGAGSERYAYIKFMKPEAADEAIRNSGKVFLGQEMKIAMKGFSSRRRASREEDDLTFDPHATRTVFIGNLEKTTTHGELREIFESFGDVVDVDIKKMQTGLTTYAFIQYIDIDGAMQAKRKMDRQYLGQHRLKVGYGRGTPTNTLWVGNLVRNVSDHQVSKAFHSFGYVQRCLIDTDYWQALVRFETIESSTQAFTEMHGKQLLGKRLLVDYASPSCRDGFYARMERNGLLDRRDLELSPTPPDAHLNYQNTVRGGRFQTRGNFNSRHSAGNPYMPHDYHDYEDRHAPRYSDRIKSEYENELREYGAARDRYRSRRERSTSRESLSPKRHRSRESVSPVSTISFYSDRKLKIEKKKKRKKDADDSPPTIDEPLKKKEKRKKKDKKEKTKKDKIVKGTIDLGYNMNEDDDSAAKKVPPKTDGGEPLGLKSKVEIKKEKKERKKLEKAEKIRKKAEKKQKKLQKRKSIDQPIENTDIFKDANVDKKPGKIDLKTEDELIKTDSDKLFDSMNLNNSRITGNIDTTLSAKPFDNKGNNENESKSSANVGIVNSSEVSTANIKTEIKDESKLSGDIKCIDKNLSCDNSECKVNGSMDIAKKLDNNSSTSLEDKSFNSEKHQKEVNSRKSDAKTSEKKPNKKRKVSSDKESKEKLLIVNDTKDSSESSSSSSSSSSESEDSDDSTDDDVDKDLIRRSYKHSNKDKDRQSVKKSPLPEADKKVNDAKPREPKAYRQLSNSSDFNFHDGRKDGSLERHNEREYGRSRYINSDRRRSPLNHRPSSSCEKPSDRSKSPNLRRSPNINERTRSRSPYQRRRGRSPTTRSKPSERKENSHYRSDLQRTPPHMPIKESQKSLDIAATGYPTKTLTTNMTNPSYTSPGAAGTENPHTLLDLLRRFPVMWQGLLGLKNDTAAVQMHFLSGNVNLAECYLPRAAQLHDVPPLLRIVQRMKLEPSQLDGVNRRIEVPKEHCMLLALPCGRDPLDVHAQTRALKTGFITYLQQKGAAGIINVASAENAVAASVVHIFPPCDFAQGHLARVAPDLLNSAADSGHLMVLITPL